MDTTRSYHLRWRGRVQGPFTFAQIERKLAESEIGMLHEIEAGGQWVTLKQYLEQVDAERLAATDPAAADSPTQEYSGKGSSKSSTETKEADELDESGISVGDCIKHAWQVTTRNPVETIIGFLLFNFIVGVMLALYWGVSWLAIGSRSLSYNSHNILLYALSIICSVTLWLLYNFLGGALLGGLWYLFVRVVRGESGGLNDLFAGFKRNLLQLAIGLFVSNLLLLFIILLPWIIFAEILTIFFVASETTFSLSSMAGQTALFFTGLFGWVGLLVAGVASLGLYSYVFTTRFLYVIPLMVDRRISYFKALNVSSQYVSRQFWSVFGLLLLALILGLAGALLCGVGMVFTCPLSFAALAVGYTAIFDGVDTEKRYGSSHFLRWLLAFGLGLVLLLGAAGVVVDIAKFGGGPKLQGITHLEGGKEAGLSIPKKPETNAKPAFETTTNAADGANTVQTNKPIPTASSIGSETATNGFSIVTSEFINTFPERVIGRKVAVLHGTYQEMVTSYLENVPETTLEENGLASTITVDAKRNLVEFWADDRDGHEFYKFIGAKDRIGEQLLALKRGGTVNIYGKGFLLEKAEGKAAIWVDTIESVVGNSGK
jgi:uncharacterized membrane protein